MAAECVEARVPVPGQRGQELLGDLDGGRVQPVADPAPLAGLPALSIPCGFDEKGLPVGLQLTGNYFSEARLLGTAHCYQQSTDWHLRVPKETPL